MSGGNKSVSKIKQIEQLNKKYKDLNEELKKLHTKVELAVKLKRDVDKFKQNDEEKKAKEAEQQYEAAVFHANRKKETLLKKYAKDLKKQTFDFFRGPVSWLDEDVQDWIIRTYPAVRLLMSSDFMKFNPIPELSDLSRHLYIPRDLAVSFFNENAPDNVFFGSDNRWGADQGGRIQVKVPEAEEAYNRFINSRPFKPLFKALKGSLDNYADPRPEPDYYKEDKDRIDTFVRKLKRAKTTFNSDEYKAIYNLTEELNKTEKVPKTENMYLSRKENYAVKLFAIKNAIDKYIEHKGKDGVKRNVYHKLAAVEELHKFVISKIQELKPDTFWAGSDKIDASIVKSEDFSKQFSDAAITNNLKSAKKEYGFIGKKSECRNVLDCMGRIIQKAKADNRGDKQLSDLNKMRQDFFEKPGSDITPLKDKQSASKTAM